MKSFFNEYSQVLVIIIVVIALIAIAMGIKTVMGSSITDLANNFDNKAQEILNDGGGTEEPATIELEAGEKIKLNLFGTGDKQLVVLNVNGTTAEVLSLEIIQGKTYQQPSQTTNFDGKTGLEYEGSAIDTAINGADFYDKLTTEIKSAIVPKKIKQTYYDNSTSSGTNDFKSVNDNLLAEYYFSGKKQIETDNEKNVYILDVQDLLDYFALIGHPIAAGDNINDYLSAYITPGIPIYNPADYWALRTATGSNSLMTIYVSNSWGCEIYPAATATNMFALPVFQIDLSKVEFTKVSSNPSQAR